MHKLKIIVLAAFCTGVLLSGIGIGISMVEYSSLEYTGVHILGEKDRTTIVKDIPVKTEEGKKILIPIQEDMDDIEYDEEVPDKTVRFELTYNPDSMDINVISLHNNTEEHSGCIEVVYYDNDGFDMMMKSKDFILEELKKGKIGSYRIDDYYEVKISANPAMEKYLDVERYY